LWVEKNIAIGYNSRMNRGRIISVALLILSLIFGAINKVEAQGTVRPPTFPSCGGATNPGDYKSVSGYNRIVGVNEAVYSNSDTYKQNNNNYVQCVCYLPAQTRGVQVNWWSADNLSQEEVNYFVSSGWIDAQGKDWGLDNKRYLAYKVNYQCPVINRPTGTVTPAAGSPTPTQRISPTPTKVSELRTTVTPTPTVTGMSCDAKIPTNVRLLSLKKIDPDCLDAVWSVSASTVTGYEVKYGTESGVYTQTEKTEGRGTTKRICGLDLEKPVYVTVKAQNGCALSTISNELRYPKTVTTSGTLADTAGGEDWFMAFGVIVGGLILWKGLRGLNKINA